LCGKEGWISQHDPFAQLVLIEKDTQTAKTNFSQPFSVLTLKSNKVSADLSPGDALEAARRVCRQAGFVHVGRRMGEIGKVARVRYVQSLERAFCIVRVGMQMQKALQEDSSGCGRPLAQVLLGYKIVASSLCNLAQTVERGECGLRGVPGLLIVVCKEEALSKERVRFRVIVRVGISSVDLERRLVVLDGSLDVVLAIFCQPLTVCRCQVDARRGPVVLETVFGEDAERRLVVPNGGLDVVLANFFSFCHPAKVCVSQVAARRSPLARVLLADVGEYLQRRLVVLDSRLEVLFALSFQPLTESASQAVERVGPVAWVGLAGESCARCLVVLDGRLDVLLAVASSLLDQSMSKLDLYARANSAARRDIQSALEQLDCLKG
jgi:hypothetical protein